MDSLAEIVDPTEPAEPKRRKRLTDDERQQRETEKEKLRETINLLLKPIWDHCGQPENFSHGVNFIIKVYPKYRKELFDSKIIPWCREYMRQYELSKKNYRGKLVPTLPNLYTFIQRERWNDNLPIPSFTELRENGSTESKCQCGKPATQHTGLCAACHVKKNGVDSPTSIHLLRDRWQALGIRKDGTMYATSCMKFLKENKLLGWLPTEVRTQVSQDS